MSNQIVASVWDKFPESGALFVAFVALARECNDQGNCSVSIAELAWSARISRKTIILSVAALKRDRWIFTSRRQGRGYICSYQINLAKLEATRPRSEKRADDEIKRAAAKAREVQKKRLLRELQKLEAGK